MKSLLVASLLAFVGLAGLVHAADKPNVIIINIDDLGYADVGAFGSTLNRTPNVDRMASEGCKLTSFYAAPVCSPSRAALMTGCYPKRALCIPGVLFPIGGNGLSPKEITIAELLRDQGYATACVGKWHLGDQPEFLPTRQGFDVYYGLPYSNDMGPAGDGVKSNLGDPVKTGKPEKGQPPLPLMRQETVLQRVLAEDQGKLVENYTNEAKSFISANKDKPFFLYMPHSAVHFPLYPGKAFHDKSKNGLYGDWVEEVDWSVGQILETVRNLGLSEKTLVIFTSDNGGTARGFNTPLRGHKASTLEGGMRVVTIAWMPKSIAAGSTCNVITGMIDVLPTVVGLAGGTVPTDRVIDGRDLWPSLTGKPDAKPPHDVFYYFKGLVLEAVRQGPWKLHLAKKELYNLDSDIGEANNVASANPDIVAQIVKLAQAMDGDLGVKEKGPGVRELGTVADPQPLIDHAGKVRAGFEAK
jgi:arylsulfatase A